MTRRLLFLAPLALVCMMLFGGGSASATVGPQFTAPAASSTQGASIHVAFSLPATPTPGSTTITFTPTVGSPLVYGIVDDSAAKDFSFPAAFPGSSAQITTGGGAPLPDGTYSVKLTWTANSVQNELTNTNVVVKTTSTPPTLISPADNTRSQSLAISYSLPDPPFAGSTRIRFDVIDGPTACTVYLTDVAEDTVRSFTLDPANPLASSEVASTSPSSCTLADGAYDVGLIYADSAGNAASSDWATPVTIDRTTAAPTLTSPASGADKRGNLGIEYSLPETAQAGSVALSFSGPSTSTVNLINTATGAQTLTLDPSTLTDPAKIASVTGDATLAAGLYSVSVSYQDTLGNAVATSALATNVQIGPAPAVVPPPAGGSSPSETCFKGKSPGTWKVAGKYKRKKAKVEFGVTYAKKFRSADVTVARKGAKVKVVVTVDGKSFLTTKAKNDSRELLAGNVVSTVEATIKFSGVTKKGKFTVKTGPC